MVPAESVQAVREKAELLNGGASLGERGDALAEIAVGKALAFCQRRDVPADMEQAVAALLLALWRALPRTGESGESGEAPAEGGTSAEASGGGPVMDWAALLAAGAVKTVQRGDTSITFQSGGGASSALSGTAARPSMEEALEDLKPWRRLGRLQPEPPERRTEP